MKEAEFVLKEVAGQSKISEGLDILEHRQKMIKMADMSDMGWKTVAVLLSGFRKDTLKARSLGCRILQMVQLEKHCINDMDSN